MIANDETQGPTSLNKLRAHRLRIIGIFICLVGIASAGVVYWMGKRAELSDDPSMVGYDRAARRQIGVMYGKFGEMVEDFSDDLKQPGTQAIIIACVSVTITCGCFYFSRLLENDAS